MAAITKILLPPMLTRRERRAFPRRGKAWVRWKSMGQMGQSAVKVRETPLVKVRVTPSRPPLVENKRRPRQHQMSLRMKRFRSCFQVQQPGPC